MCDNTRTRGWKAMRVDIPFLVMGVISVLIGLAMMVVEVLRARNFPDFAPGLIAGFIMLCAAMSLFLLAADIRKGRR